MTDGTKAIELALAAAPETERIEQLGLFPAAAIGELPAAAVDRQAALRRGPGRPAGAVNKRTAAMADYLLKRYPSPLQALAETYSRSVHDLAAELGCSRLEAFQLQVRAATELAPYRHGKMPVSIDLNSNNIPMIMMADPAAFTGGSDQAEHTLSDLVEYQEVTDDVAQD